MYVCMYVCICIRVMYDEMGNGTFWGWDQGWNRREEGVGMKGEKIRYGIAEVRSGREERWGGKSGLTNQNYEA